MIISLTVERVVDDGQQGETGSYHYEFDRDEVLVGRDRATDIRLPHPAISLVHLRLLRKKGRLWAIDDGSTNGTLVDGGRLEPGRGHAVVDGSRLRLGPFEITVGPGQPKAAELTAPADTARLARQMVLEVIGARGVDRAHPVLEVRNGPDRGARLSLPPLGPARVVGRGEACALRLSDADASRQHFEVQNKGTVVELRDLGSKNGVERGGQRVEGTVALSHGDELAVGHTRLRFTDPAEGLLRQLEHGDDEPSAAAPEDPPFPGEVTAPPASESADLPPGAGPGSLLLMVLVGMVVLAAVAGAVWLLV